EDQVSRHEQKQDRKRPKKEGQRSAGASQAQAERIHGPDVWSLAAGNRTQDPDESRHDENGREELEDRPDAPAPELAAEFLLKAKVFRELGTELGEVAALFSHVHQGNEEGGQGGLLSFQDVFQAVASFQTGEDAAGQGSDRRVAFLCQAAKDVTNREPGAEIM